MKDGCQMKLSPKKIDDFVIKFSVRCREMISKGKICCEALHREMVSKVNDLWL